MWWIDQSPVSRLRKKPPPYPRPGRRHGMGVGVGQDLDRAEEEVQAQSTDQEAIAANLLRLKQRHGLAVGDNRRASASSPPPTAAGVCVEEEEEEEEEEEKDVEDESSVVDGESIDLGMPPHTPELSTISDSDADADEAIPSPPPPPTPAEEDHQEQQQPRPPSPSDAVTISQVGLELEASLRAFRRQFTCSSPPPVCGSGAAEGGIEEEPDEQAEEAAAASNDPPSTPPILPPTLLPRMLGAAPPSLAFAKAYLEEFRAYRWVNANRSLSGLTFDSFILCLYVCTTLSRARRVTCTYAPTGWPAATTTSSKGIRRSAATRTATRPPSPPPPISTSTSPPLARLVCTASRVVGARAPSSTTLPAAAAPHARAHAPAPRHALPRYQTSQNIQKCMYVCMYSSPNAKKQQPSSPTSCSARSCARLSFPLLSFRSVCVAQLRVGLVPIVRHLLLLQPAQGARQPHRQHVLALCVRWGST